MKCRYCDAEILRDNVTENHGMFHRRCYGKWICELKEEFRSKQKGEKGKGIELQGRIKCGEGKARAMIAGKGY